MVGWRRQTDAVFAVGGLDAAAIMISPATPWTLGITISGLELLVPAVAVLPMDASESATDARNP
jgi:hypothetical protein